MKNPMFKHGWKIGTASFKCPTYFDSVFLKGRKTATKILKILSNE